MTQRSVHDSAVEVVVEGHRHKGTSRSYVYLQNTIELSYSETQNNDSKYMTDNWTANRYIHQEIQQESKEEEEEKYDYYKETKLINPSKRTISYAEEMRAHSNFIEYRVDDYIQCKHDIDDITKCNAMQRIIHLLKYYKNAHEMMMKNEEIVLIYEYITSLSKYSPSTLMEDWYHCKTKHFETEFDYKWIINNKEINCNNDINPNCIHIKRNQRERNREIYDVNNKETDYKNIILRDQLDSIHVYLFHALPTRRNNKYELKTIPEIDDSKYNAEEAMITIDYPESKMSRINDQYIDISEHEPFIKNKNVSNSNPNNISTLFINDMKQKIDALNDEKLNEHKDKIIQYLKQNKIDYDAFNNIGRKEFSVSIATHCNDTKLKGKLLKLYKEMKKYHVDRKGLPEDMKQNDANTAIIQFINK